MVETRIFSVDFETSKDNNKTWVYLWTCAELFTEFKTHGTNIDTFIGFMEENGGIYYFHNAKYDFSYILTRLFERGFEYTEKKDKYKFKTLYSGSNIFYYAEIYFGEKKIKNKKIIQTAKIYDSQKLLLSSVDSLAKEFNLNIRKLSIDYNRIIKPDSKIDDEILKYAYNDVLIIKQCLEYFLVFGDKMTIAANALNKYKSLNDKFKSLFPLFDYNTDEFCRKAYRGGICWKHPKIKDVNKGSVYDVNSLYPYVMKESVLPFGHPVYVVGKCEKNEIFPLFIQRLRISCKVKKNKIAFLQLKNNLVFAENEYINEIDTPEEFYLTNIDLDLLYKNYTINYIDYLDGFLFHGKKGMFDSYVEWCMKLKNDGVDYHRAIGKRYANSLYGKFGKNPNSTRKIPYYCDGKVCFNTTDIETSQPIYVPVAVFVTSYARNYTLSAAEIYYKDDIKQNKLFYIDTDSLHLKGHFKPHIKIDDKKLGYWKNEFNFYKGKYIRQKCYYLISGKKHMIKCAGMSKELKKKVKFKDFDVGFKGVRLKQKMINGGIALIDEEFTIK